MAVMKINTGLWREHVKPIAILQNLLFWDNCVGLISWNNCSSLYDFVSSYVTAFFWSWSIRVILNVASWNTLSVLHTAREQVHTHLKHWVRLEVCTGTGTGDEKTDVF
jgi:hypothetical protein